MAILDLAAVAEYVLPWTVVALTYGAFETLPYEDALLKMKEGLVMIDRRAAMYDVKFAASSTKATGTWSTGNRAPERYTTTFFSF